MDFQKAFDSVDRATLWRVLRALGLHGCILNTLVAMYAHVRSTVRMNGKYSEYFESLLGVKQGDPLSPLLFGLLIDRFQEYVEHRSPGMGIRMGILLVVVLFFADDLAIVAKSPAELQHFLDMLHSFCVDIQLTVNVSKTVGMVFNRTNVSGLEDISYNGVKLQFVEEFRYLGAIFHHKHGVKPSTKFLVGAGKRAIHALYKACSLAGINMANAKCHIFDSQVVPVMTYASEIWAPFCYTNPSWNKCLDTDIERVHMGFLRHLFGIRASTSLWMILREFGRLPIFYLWWSKVVKFLIKVRSLSEMMPLKQAYLADIELYNRGKTCWLGGVVSFLRMIFDDFPVEGDALRQRLTTLSLAVVKRALVDKWKEFWVEVETGSRQATKALFYITHIACATVLQKNGWFAPAPHFSVYMPGKNHSNLVRFRLGNHDLLVERYRWQKPSERESFDCRCTHCTSGEKEDECHFLFKCIAFENVRLEDKYTKLLDWACDDIRRLFSYEDQIVVAKFLSDMLGERA